MGGCGVLDTFWLPTQLVPIGCHQHSCGTAGWVENWVEDLGGWRASCRCSLTQNHELLVRNSLSHYSVNMNILACLILLKLIWLHFILFYAMKWRLIFIVLSPFCHFSHVIFVGWHLPYFLKMCHHICKQLCKFWNFETARSHHIEIPTNFQWHQERGSCTFCRYAQLDLLVTHRCTIARHEL